MAARRRAILAAGGASAQVVRLCLRRSSAGGQGKSGAKPARSRHCERALRRRRCHWEADGFPGRRGAESEARRPGPGRSHTTLEERVAMTNQIRGAVPAALAIVAASAPVADAAPVTVDVRVEGATQTIFEGPVTTDVHQTITPTDGQPRTCDGSSVGKPAGPTAIGALDDAARTGGFIWDARWDSGFNDYYPFLRIGSDEIDSSSHYLALFVNWTFAEVGGCGQRVGAGGQILWGYEDFNP